MEGNEIFIMIMSMLASFLLGMIGMLFFGGRTILNYIKVKASRGGRVLLFARTSFGWRSFTAKKKEATVTWKHDGVPKVTKIDGGLTRYMRVDAVFVDANASGSSITLKDGNFYPDDFDPEVYNNLLLRALTRSNAEGNEDLKKMLAVVLFLVVIAALGVVVVYFKVSNIDVCPAVNTVVQGVIN